MEALSVLLDSWVGIYLAERDLGRSTSLAYLCAVRKFREWLGGAPTVQHAADRLNEYIRYRCESGSRETASFHRRAILTILRAAEERGVCSLPRKVRPVRRDEHETIGFEPTEIRRLIAHATPIQRAAILFVYDTGARRGDVFRVCWSSVSGYMVRWLVHKSHRRHSALLRPETLDALNAVKDASGRLVPYPHSLSSWAKAWKSLGKRAGVDVRRRGLQAIRRTAATLIAKTQGVGTAAQFLGHSASSGIVVAVRYYMVPSLLDETPPSPPPLLPPEEKSA